MTWEPFSCKVILIFTVIVLDAVATVYLMAHGYGEVNPVMGWVAEASSPSMMAVSKIAWSLALLGLLLGLKEFRRLIDYLIVGYAALYSTGWSAQLIWEVLRNGPGK